MDINKVNELARQYNEATTVAERRTILSRAINELDPTEYGLFFGMLETTQQTDGAEPAAGDDGGFLSKLKDWVSSGIKTGVFDPTGAPPQGGPAPGGATSPNIVPTAAVDGQIPQPGRPDGGVVPNAAGTPAQAPVGPTPTTGAAPAATPSGSPPTSTAASQLDGSVAFTAGGLQAAVQVRMQDALANGQLLRLGITDSDARKRIIDWYRNLQAFGQQRTIFGDIEYFKNQVGATNTQLADFFIDISNGINREINNVQAPTYSEWRFVRQDDGTMRWSDTPGIVDGEGTLILDENGNRFFYNPNMPELFLDQKLAQSEEAYADFVDRLATNGILVDTMSQPAVVEATTWLLEQANMQGKSVDVMLTEMESRQSQIRQRLRAMVAYTPTENVEDVAQQTAVQWMGRLLEDAELQRLTTEYQRMERSGMLDQERARIEAQTGVGEYSQVQGLSDFVSRYIRDRYTSEVKVNLYGLMEDFAKREYGDQVLRPQPQTVEAGDMGAVEEQVGMA